MLRLTVEEIRDILEVNICHYLDVDQMIKGILEDLEQFEEEE